MEPVTPGASVCPRIGLLAACRHQRRGARPRAGNFDGLKLATAGPSQVDATDSAEMAVDRAI